MKSSVTFYKNIIYLIVFSNILYIPYNITIQIIVDGNIIQSYAEIKT